MLGKVEMGRTVKAKLGPIKTSLPLIFGTNVFACLPKHFSGQSKEIQEAIYRDSQNLFYIDENKPIWLGENLYTEGGEIWSINVFNLYLQDGVVRVGCKSRIFNSSCY